MARIAWADPPPDAAAALDRQFGPLLDAHDVEAGAGSDVAAYVHLDDDTATGLFVKGARADGNAWGAAVPRSL